MSYYVSNGNFGYNLNAAPPQMLGSKRKVSEAITSTEKRSRGAESSHKNEGRSDLKSSSLKSEARRSNDDDGDDDGDTDTSADERKAEHDVSRDIGSDSEERGYVEGKEDEDDEDGEDQLTKEELEKHMIDRLKEAKKEDNKAKKTARSLLDKAAKNKSTPLYNRIISDLGTSKLFGYALQAYTDMKANNVPPNEYTFTNLINSCVRTWELDRARAFFEEMKEHNLKPNEVTYTAFLKGLCSGGAIEEGLKLVETMCETGVNPNLRTFNTLFRGCLRCGELAVAEKTKALMEKCRVEPDITTLEYLARTRAQDLNVPGAMELLAQMEKMLPTREQLRRGPEPAPPSEGYGYGSGYGNGSGSGGGSGYGGGRYNNSYSRYDNSDSTGHRGGYGGSSRGGGGGGGGFEGTNQWSTSGRDHGYGESGDSATSSNPMALISIPPAVAGAAIAVAMACAVLNDVPSTRRVLQRAHDALALLEEPDEYHSGRDRRGGRGGGRGASGARGSSSSANGRGGGATGGSGSSSSFRGGFGGTNRMDAKYRPMVSSMMEPGGGMKPSASGEGAAAAAATTDTSAGFGSILKLSVPQFFRIRESEMRADMERLQTWITQASSKLALATKRDEVMHGLSWRATGPLSHGLLHAHRVFAHPPNSRQVAGNKNPTAAGGGGGAVKKDKSKEKDKEKDKTESKDSSAAKDGVIDWAEVFGNSNPVRVEVCSGLGEWICDRAARYPNTNWIGIEMRYDRVFTTWARMLLRHLPNVAIIWGEARGALRTCFSRKSVTQVFVNYPDPPIWRGSSMRLVDDTFVKAAYRALCKAAKPKPGQSTTSSSSSSLTTKMTTSTTASTAREDSTSSIKRNMPTNQSSVASTSAALSSSSASSSSSSSSAGGYTGRFSAFAAAKALATTPHSSSAPFERKTQNKTHSSSTDGGKPATVAVAGDGVSNKKSGSEDARVAANASSSGVPPLFDAGILTLVTDDAMYANMMLTELETEEAQTMFETALEDGARYSIHLPKDYGNSYYNRFWNNGNKMRRFMIKMRRL